MKQWNFRRCEDIAWIKTNKSKFLNADDNGSDSEMSASGGQTGDAYPDAILQHTTEHCLMGIQGNYSVILGIYSISHSKLRALHTISYALSVQQYFYMFVAYRRLYRLRFVAVLMVNILFNKTISLVEITPTSCIRRISFEAARSLLTCACADLCM